MKRIASNKEKLVGDLTRISMLFETIKETYWLEIFTGYLLKTQSVEEPRELKDIAREIKQLYGGMGSFNDLVLGDENNRFVKENAKLSKLRHKMFEDLIAIITS